MVRHFGILIGGCSLSSASAELIIKALHSNGYNIPRARATVGASEIYKPQKNKFYKAGMSVIEMMSLTLDSVPEIVFKLAPGKIKNQVVLLNALIHRDCKFISLYRYNILDKVLCNLRDFKHDPCEISDKYSKFSLWRHSDDRKNYVFPCGPKEFVEMLRGSERNQKEFNKYLDIHLPKIPRISTESIHGYESDLSEEALDKSLQAMSIIFDQFGEDFDADTTRKLLEEKRGTRNKPYSHSALRFSHNSTLEIREHVEKAGYGKYWRD